MPKDRTALVLGVVLLAACGSTSESSRTVTDLQLDIHSSEEEPGRNIVVIGENASANIDTQTDEGCFVDSPCSTSADVQVVSSDPGVLSPAQRQVRTPAFVALVAHAPGTTTLTVTADGLTQSKRIDVVAQPLPLDAIQVTVIGRWNDLPVQYDPSGSLTSLELPTGEYAALEIKPLRGGVEVFGVPITISEYDPSVALTSVGCRAVRDDPQCDVYSDGWILGVTPGDAIITVWARASCDISDPSCTWTSFTTHVVERQPLP